MSKANPKKLDDDLLDHYDFSGGVRGKYATRYREGTNVVLLDDDVAKTFPDALSVNRALRALVNIIRNRPARKSTAKKTSNPTSRSGGR